MQLGSRATGGLRGQLDESLHRERNDGDGREGTATHCDGRGAIAPPPLRFRRSDFGSQNRPVGTEEMRLGQVEMEWASLADSEPRGPADPSNLLVLDAGKLGEDDRFCTQ